MKKMLVLLAIAAFVATTAFIAVAADAPAEVKYETKFGDVTFDHVAHKDMADCATCHHTGDNVGCKTCHGVNSDAPKSKKAYHDQCKGCHKKEGGPTKCKGCHVK